jgi:uncharacterized repeat protein (TIGR01451 family)
MKTAIIHRMVFGAIVVLTIAFPFSVSPSLMAERMSTSEPDQLPDDCLPKDPPPPVVKIKVRVPACAAPGQQITYRICIENCSTSEAHHVIVKNALPSNAKFVKADPTPSKQEPELQWNLGTVGGGAIREIVLVVQPTNREDVKNCARVQFEHGQCVVTRLAARGAPGDRPPIITPVPGEDQPILDLSIDGPKKQYSNLATKYIVTLTNKGKASATRTLVSVRLPNKLKFVKASDNAQGVDDLVAWNLGTLEAGKSRVMELTLRAAEAGEFCIKASAEADHGARADVEYCTKFASTSAMTLEMVGKEGVVFVGGKTSYPVVIKNQGSTPITNVKVRAFVPDAMRFERSSPKFDKADPVASGQWIEFKTLPAIEVGALVRYEIFVEAMKAGVTRFHIEVAADELTSGPIVEQEITNIVDHGEK